MAADTPVLLAAVARQVGRNRPTYSVIHLPDPDEDGATYCRWPGQLTATTVAAAILAKAVSCNRCPLIKAARSRT